MATDLTTFPSHQRVFDEENLLTQIFLRISTKPLVRFKCVCKHWNSIVSSDQFARIHTLFHSPNSDPTSGVFLRRLGDVADYNSPNYNYHFLSLPFGPLSLTPFRFSTPSPKLLQSCNGLLLLSVSIRNCYCIYNPATSQFKELPILNLSSSARVMGVSLAFDPPRFKGFRVVCVATTDTSAYTYRIISYCDSWNSWKDWEGNPFNAPFDLVFSNGVYWNGAVHWISLRENSVYFDIETEKLGRFPSPPISPRYRGYRQLCELSGKLHYVDGDEYGSPVYKVSALIGYEEGWVLRYTVDVPKLGIGEKSAFSMLCLVSNEREERSLEMVVNMRRKILAFDLEKKSWRTICELESKGCTNSSGSSDKLQFGWFDAYAYTATLALF